MYINPDEYSVRPTLPLKEETTYVKINKLLLDSRLKNTSSSNNDQRSFFRFARDKNTNILYINYIDSFYKNWDKD